MRRFIKTADEIRGKTLEIIKKEIIRIQEEVLKELEDAGVVLDEEEKVIFLKEIREEIVERLYRNLRK